MTLLRIGLVAFALTAACTSFCAPAAEADPKNVVAAHITRNGNVAITQADGSKHVLTRKGHGARVVLAKDRRTVAWVRDSSRRSAVFIYRDGTIKSIAGDPFVRGIWFVDAGRKIGVDSGGLDFAGVEILYDVGSLKELDRVSQATTPTSDRPSWAASSDRYEEER